MKQYKITTYGGGSYTASVDSSGVVDVVGLPNDVAESLKLSVKRHMEKRNLPPVTALGLAAGRYSSVEDINNVSGQS